MWVLGLYKSKPQGSASRLCCTVPLGPAQADARGWLLFLGPPQLVPVLPLDKKEKCWLLGACTGCVITVGGMSGAAGGGVNGKRRFFV